MQRRTLLRNMLAAPFLAGKWKAGAPKGFGEEIATWMRAAGVPGAVFGALRDFRLAWMLAAGVRVAGSEAKVDGRTLFQAASLTKQVTAHAALMLVDQGKLELDKPLVSWVDDLPDAAARPVTVRQVLSHSSGFRNWRFGEAGKPVPALVPEFPPGSRYGYSGEGYFYLQRVMEQATGIGFGQLIQNLVFEPLKMSNSAMVWNPATLEQTALPHNRRGEVRSGWDKGVRALHAWAERNGKTVAQMRYEESVAAGKEAGDPLLPNWLLPNAAASMVTNAEDYMRFLSGALRRTDLTRQEVKINEFLGWGLGWSIERAAGRTYLWQWGDNSGFKNIVFADPESGSAIFGFTNGDGGARLYDRVVTRATGHEHPALFWL